MEGKEELIEVQEGAVILGFHSVQPGARDGLILPCEQIWGIVWCGMGACHNYTNRSFPCWPI